MQGFMKSSEKRHLREKRHTKDSGSQESTKTPRSRPNCLLNNYNIAQSDIEFKKFEKLLGDSLEKVQSLRKGWFTGREQNQGSCQKKQKCEYFLTETKQRKPPTFMESSKSPKASLLSTAETQLTDSYLGQDRMRDSGLSASMTVEYLLNQNRNLKQQIQMILKSRSTLNQTEEMVKKISEYRKIISDQQAQLNMLRKYNLQLIKDAEKSKLDLAKCDMKLQTVQQELNRILSQPTLRPYQLRMADPQLRSCSNFSLEFRDFAEKLRVIYSKNQPVLDSLRILQKQIGLLRQDKSSLLHSPRRTPVK